MASEIRLCVMATKQDSADTYRLTPAKLYTDDITMLLLFLTCRS